MNSTRIAQTAAVAATIAWTAKAVAIGTAGGLDKSPLETPLFLLGLLCFLVAAVAYGAALTRARSVPVRVAAGVGAVIGGVGLTVMVQGVLSALGLEDHWVWTELNLWVAVALLLVLTHRLEADAAHGVGAATVRANEPSALRNP